MNPNQTLQDGIMELQKLKDTAVEYLVKYGFQVLGGLVILAIGFWVAGWVSNLVLGLLKKKKMDITLAKFLAMAVRGVIMAFVILMAIEKFGVTISPLIATASALIFGASFAIQAPLSNYAAGLTVILTHPFTVGDTISVKEVHGVVEEVKLPCTILINGDGERITIPNKDVVGEILFNSKENKLVERSIGISYADDPVKAVKIVADTLAALPKVTKTPPPQVGVDNFGDSAISIGMRYWVPTKDYFPSLYEANLRVYQALTGAGVTIPFPQREVRILSGDKPFLK